MCDEHSKTSDPAVGSTRLVRQSITQWLGCGDPWKRLVAEMLLTRPDPEKRYRFIDKKSVYWRRKLGLPIGPSGPKPLFPRSKYMLKKYGPNERGQARREKI